MERKNAYILSNMLFSQLRLVLPEIIYLDLKEEKERNDKGGLQFIS